MPSVSGAMGALLLAVTVVLGVEEAQHGAAPPPRSVSIAPEGSSLADLPALVARAPWEPLVLRGAFQGVDTAALVEEAGDAALGGVIDIARGEPPAIFHHNARKPLAGMRGIEPAHERSAANASARDVVSAIKRGERWRYAAAGNSSLGRALRALIDVDALSAALLDAGRAPPLSLSPEHHASTSVWLAGTGTTSHCHYDASANVYAQLDGARRFELAPPCAHAALRVHSYLHPRFRRAQVDDPAAALAASAGGACGARAGGEGGCAHAPCAVELSAGDVLYLPPFHFHHVTPTSTPSLSANAWMGSAPVARAQHAVARGASSLLPTRPGEAPRLQSRRAAMVSDEPRPEPWSETAGWSAQERAALLELALAAFARSALGLDTSRAARAWLHATMRARWATLVSAEPAIARKLARFCAPDAREGRRALAAAALEAAAVAGVGGLDELERGAAAAGAPFRGLPAGADELEAANLAEQAAHALLRRPAVVGSFLWGCFGDAELGGGGAAGASTPLGTRRRGQSQEPDADAGEGGGAAAAAHQCVAESL